MSVIQIFVMMIGELNYETNFLKPNLDHKLPFTFLTYVLFIEFALLMPILLVNLLVSRLPPGTILKLIKKARNPIYIQYCIDLFKMYTGKDLSAVRR